jgi:broad specificity phosphatase PhoE
VTTSVVHLLRHGEVDNPAGILYGRLPGYRLSTAGREMSRRAADWLADRDVALLRASPLERAQETAAEVAAVTGRPVDTDERLIESGNRFQGHSARAGRLLADPANWRLLVNPFRPSWGEPYREVVQRMLAATLDAAAAAAPRAAVCVSHQLPIWVLRRFVAGQPLWHRPDRRQCALASVTSMHVQDGRIVAVEYHEPAGPAHRIPGA